jgi:two-component sensor histidine kinase
MKGIDSRLLHRRHAIEAAFRRLLAFYVGKVERNTIEYWQRSIFYIIALSGLVAGTLCIVSVSIWLASTGRPLGLVLLVPFLCNSWIILSPRIAVRTKVLVIAFNFYAIAVLSFVLAGPEGEGGIWFTVSVLILSLFIGFKPAFLAACLNFATEMAFAILHAKGLISWTVLRDFKSFSWVIQGSNIFLFDLIFAMANAMLIRGVDGSFKSLKAVERRTRTLLTEQARLKDEVNARLVEKEVLLRELHHRVKNNLAMIASLIRLSSDGIEDRRALAAFDASYRRIDSIALLHEELYGSENLADLDFGAYLRSIAQRLFASGEGSSGIRLDVDAGPLFLPMNMALPLALVANELVTNSIKYAFPNRGGGSVTIRLSRQGDAVALQVLDNGVGLPAGMRPESSTSLGLVLVYQLTKQIGASVEYRSGVGTEFSIRFRLRPEQQD